MEVLKSLRNFLVSGITGGLTLFDWLLIPSRSTDIRPSTSPTGLVSVDLLGEIDKLSHRAFY